MTDVTEWARAEAERQYPNPTSRQARLSFIEGVVVLADRLLSDEAVERSALGLFLHAHTDPEGDVSEQCVPDEDDMRYYRVAARAALVAALAAVTEGSK